MTDPAAPGPPAAWHLHAGRCVLLDGFHALKHALRFGAEVPVAVTSDRAAPWPSPTSWRPTCAGRWRGC